MKQDVIETHAAKSVIEKELHNMLMQLHSLQLQIQAQKGVEVDSEAIKKKLVSQDKQSYRVFLFLVFFSFRCIFSDNYLFIICHIYFVVLNFNEHLISQRSICN